MDSKKSLRAVRGVRTYGPYRERAIRFAKYSFIITRLRDGVHGWFVNSTAFITTVGDIIFCLFSASSSFIPHT